jgi:hypothetical protein
MRGKGLFLLTAAIVSILAATHASAEDPLGIPVSEESSPGVTWVKFDGVTYRISTLGRFRLIFERIDREHHRVWIIPGYGEVMPYDPITLQWKRFPPVTLELLGGEQNSWMLGVETGYAEK